MAVKIGCFHRKCGMTFLTLIKVLINISMILLLGDICIGSSQSACIEEIRHRLLHHLLGGLASWTGPGKTQRYEGSGTGNPKGETGNTLSRSRVGYLMQKGIVLKPISYISCLLLIGPRMCFMLRLPDEYVNQNVLKM